MPESHYRVYGRPGRFSLYSSKFAKNSRNPVASYCATHQGEQRLLRTACGETKNDEWALVKMTEGSRRLIKTHRE